MKGTVDGVDVSVMGLREGVLQGEVSAEERWVGESQGVGLQEKEGRGRLDWSRARGRRTRR